MSPPGYQAQVVKARRCRNESQERSGRGKRVVGKWRKKVSRQVPLNLKCAAIPGWQLWPWPATSSPRSVGPSSTCPPSSARTTERKSEIQNHSNAMLWVLRLKVDRSYVDRPNIDRQKVDCIKYE